MDYAVLTRATSRRLIGAGAVVLLALAGLALRYAVFANTAGHSGLIAYADALCVWDCAWYKHIIEHGYDLEPSGAFRPGAANWAFFPLYPLAAGATHYLTGLPISLAGMLVSTTFIIAAILLGRPLFPNDRSYWMFAFLLTNGPFSVIFSTLYTESLFILLTVVTLARLQRGDVLYAGLAAGLLSATRTTGILMGPAILLEVVRQHFAAGGRLLGLPKAVITNSRTVLGLALAPVGALCYMVYLHVHMGDALAFAHIQRAWGRDIGDPLRALWSAITPTNVLHPDAMIIAVWGGAAIFGLAISLFLAWRRLWGAALFSVLVILLSLGNGVGSMVRFIAGLAPISVGLARLLAANRIIAVLVLPPLLWLNWLVTTGWIRSSFFLM
ncbi:mannosyltransferase family protein [Devosia sp. SL43]|uniref:mannosyltransferase family protein n=1 Tax=Devosia sp. SL43 TaxID=2806348 RepID=UPI001F408E7B|nr:mannosyltransferase family protein [Devosia sp. SL43]UJW87208.1 hypothetical protein IM737_08200 [Devosia sp. SL43]